MKKIKLIIEFIKLKHQGYNKEERYFKYAIKRLINFEQYEKFIDEFNKNELSIMKTNYDEDKYSDDYIRLLTIREAEKLPGEIRGIDEYYWTLSPSNFDSNCSIAYVWYVASSGSLSPWSHVTASFGIRPVINLKAEYLTSIQN